MSKNFSPRFDPINLPRRLREGLQEADSLLERGKPQQALELLSELDTSFPRQLDVLGLMANANLDMDNWFVLSEVSKLTRESSTPGYSYSAPAASLGVGVRLGHGNAALRQVFHQLQIKRQLLKVQPLKQRQHIVMGLAVTLGGDKIIGVLDAAGAALQALQRTQPQLLQQRICLGKRDLCVNRHDSEAQHFPGAFTCFGRHLVGRHAVFGLHRDALGFAAHTHFVDTCGSILDMNVFDAWLCFGGRFALRRGIGRSRRKDGLAPCQATGQQERENGVDKAHLLIVDKAAALPGAGKMPA